MGGAIQCTGDGGRPWTLAVEWPLRVLYRQLPKGRYLEVVTSQMTTHYEYGSIAVRPGAQLVECRRSSGPFLRPLVMGDRFSLQVRRPPEDGEHRAEILTSDAAIWHNSWARPPRAVRSKIASWGHNQGLKSWVYYYAKWLPAPLTWRVLRNFHPLHPSLWPRLATAVLPFDLESRWPVTERGPITRLRNVAKHHAPDTVVAAVRWRRDVWADARLRLLSDLGHLPSHVLRNYFYRRAGLTLRSTSSIHWRADSMRLS